MIFNLYSYILSLIDLTPMLIFMLIYYVYSTAYYKVYQKYDKFRDQIYIRIFVHDLFAHGSKIFYIDQQKKSKEFIRTKGDILKKDLFKAKYDSEESISFETSDYSVYYIVLSHEELDNKKMKIKFEHLNDQPSYELEVRLSEKYTLISEISYYYPLYVDQLSYWFTFLHDKMDFIKNYLNSARYITEKWKYTEIYIDFRNVDLINEVYKGLYTNYPNDIKMIESLKDVKYINNLVGSYKLTTNDLCLYNDCYNMINELYRCYFMLRKYHLEVKEFFSHKEVTEKSNKNISEDEMKFLDTLNKGIWPIEFIYKRRLGILNSSVCDGKNDLHFKEKNIVDKKIYKEKLKNEIDEDFYNNCNNNNGGISDAINVVYIGYVFLVILMLYIISLFFRK